LTTRAKAANVAAFLVWRQGRLGPAKTLAETAVALSREAGNASCLANSIQTLGNVLTLANDMEGAAIAYDQAEEKGREAGDLHCVAEVIHNRALLSMLRSDYERAGALLNEVVALARRIESPDILVNGLIDLAYVALHERRHEDAAALFRETLETNDRLGWKEIDVYCLLGLAAVAVAEGNFVRAATLKGAAEASREGLGLHTWVEQYVEEIAGQIETALRTRISDAAIADARTAGEALKLDESTAYALRA
jgi:tetratricopeptide (TPR) repeat protein